MRHNYPEAPFVIVVPYKQRRSALEHGSWHMRGAKHWREDMWATNTCMHRQGPSVLQAWRWARRCSSR